MSRLDVNGVIERCLKALKIDYVIEQGTSGIWTYRKWNSGIAECWGTTATTTYTTSSPFGGWYYAPYGVLCNFPSNLFIAAPVASVSRNNGGSGLIVFSPGAVTASSITGYVVDGINSTKSCGFMVRAIGRWK